MTLRLTLEIVPFGEEDKKYTIRQFDIFNKGQAEFGHYEYGVIDLGGDRDLPGLYDKEIFHRRDLGAEVLAQKVLKLAEESEHAT